MNRKSKNGYILGFIGRFINDSRAIGITLLGCTLISLIIANSSWSSAYLDFWNTAIQFPEKLHLPHSIVHWINDFWMAFFFLLAGMEIKRELLTGELSSFKKAILPIAAAIGGMIVPALIYIFINKGTQYEHGWGIPMATDIAFSLGVASLLGSRVPASLKIFLMALAIIDDLGAILVIALFYGSNIQWSFMAGAALICIIFLLLNKFKIHSLPFSVILGIALWYCIFNSGIHATIAGVLLAFFIPQNQVSHYEHRLHKPVNFIILPLFAAANTAIIIPSGFAAHLTSSVSWGVMLGLLIGKPVGITFMSWLTVTLRLGVLPEKSNWSQLFSIGILAAIGFTMSIFIAMLAFNDAAHQDIAKIAVLIASVAAIILSIIALTITGKKS